MVRNITPILKLAEYCNYSCYFCRYAQHPKNDVMSLEDAKTIIEKIIKYNLKNDNKKNKIIFHGGEPLLWGINNFKSIIDFEKKLESELDVSIKNSIQTNGFLINAEWIEIFKDNHFEIGISIDGPGELNGHYGIIGNQKSVNKVLESIKLLVEKNINFGVLSVITTAHMGNEKQFYEFLVNNKIKNVGLCYCFNPFDNEVIDPGALGDFLINLFDLYYFKNHELNIREFNDAILKVITGKNITCSTSCREKCGNFLTFGADAKVYFCDNYDLNKNIILGNARSDEITDIIESLDYKKSVNTAKKMFIEKCKNCNFLEICGSGCARNDVDILNNNYFCETYKKIYSHILEILK